MSKKLLFILFQLCFIAGIINGQSVRHKNIKTKLVPEIDSILNSQVKNDQIPGAVIEIKKDGQIIYKHAYGYAQKYDFNHHQIKFS